MMCVGILTAHLEVLTEALPQTINPTSTITGQIVDMYKNLVTIADDDAETVDDLLSFHADDLEVIEDGIL